ncbi:MAG TPA: hypothetical protein VED37_14555, partial [Ktedonobacteraceae bacterium]|nr:hypothetical protein [Ktedonobacteraceae bacterium]
LPLRFSFFAHCARGLITVSRELPSSVTSKYIHNSRMMLCVCYSERPSLPLLAGILMAAWGATCNLMEV